MKRREFIMLAVASSMPRRQAICMTRSEVKRERIGSCG
jgi:hypothetical protein